MITRTKLYALIREILVRSLRGILYLFILYRFPVKRAAQ